MKIVSRISSNTNNNLKYNGKVSIKNLFSRKGMKFSRDYIEVKKGL
jgi:hypothetical protein